MYIAYSLTFGDAAKQLGNPDYVSYSITGAEDLTCIISLDWTKKSISATSYHGGRECPKESDLANAKIKSDIQISMLYYLAKDEVNANTKLCETCIPWPGFADP